MLVLKVRGNTTRNRLVSWKTNILRQVAPHKTASRLTAVFNTIQHEPATTPQPKDLRGQGVRLLCKYVGKELTS